MVLKHARLFCTIVAAAGLFAATPAARAGGDASRSTAPAHTVRVRGDVKTREDNWLTDAADIAQMVIAAAAVIGFFGIGYQVRAARKNNVSDRTATLQSQWGESELMRELGHVIAYTDLTNGGDPTGEVRDCLEKVRAWKCATHVELECLPRSPRDPGAPLASQLEVLHVLLFYEDLCQRYNAKELDRTLVASSIGPELLTRFQQASWYIHWQRADSRDDLLYGEWEKALVHMRRPRHRWQRGWHEVYKSLGEYSVAFPIRAICVPPKPKNATHDDWDRATRLSDALARDTALPDELFPPSGRQPDWKSDPKRKWLVALVPGSLKDPRIKRASREERAWRREQVWRRAIAIAIERKLANMDDGQIDGAIRKLVGGGSVKDAFDLDWPPKSETR